MPSDYAGHLTTVANGSQWLTCRVQYLDDTDPFSSTNFPEPTRPPSYTFNVEIPLCEQLAGVHRLLKAPHKIDDCTLQISHTGAYLDLDGSINEQKEEFEKFFTDGKRNSIIIRTLLSIRVHSCIEKLYNSKGRELRRALFSLKQIFQDDKDLVHEFVNADGLTCLIKVGAEADQNYQNYILRALGQIMLYVDGMNGVIEHRETVRWLYTLIASRFRLVVKTTLKLLLVFVEYAEENASLLLDAVREVDKKRRQKEWANVMTVLDEKDGIDCELLVYAMTLINKTLSNIPDQDTFYDVTDALEAHGMDSITQRHLSKKGNDLDLIEQFKIYELALKHEDGDEEVSRSSAPGVGIKWNRERTKSELAVDRKSKRRNSANLTPHIEVPSPEKKTPSYLEDNIRQSKSNPNTPSRDIIAPDPPQFNKRSRSRRDELLKQHLQLQSEKKQEAELDAQTDPTISPKPWLVKKPTVNGQTNIVNNVQYNNAVAADTTDRERRRRNRDEDRDKRRTEFLNKQQNAFNNRVETTNGDLPTTNGTPPPPPVRTSSSKMLEIGTRGVRSRRANFIKNHATESPPSGSPEKLNNVITNGELQPKTQPTIRMEGDTIEIEEKVSPEIPKIKTKNDRSLPVSLSLTPVVQKPMKMRASPLKNGLITPSGDVISNDQKLMMDMLYANQAVALKQGSESDDGSEGSTDALAKENNPPDSANKTNALTANLTNGVSTTVEPEPEEVSIKSAKETMEKMFAGGKMRMPTQQPLQKVEKTITPEVIQPQVPKKDSDIMWEKLLKQSSKKSLMVSEFDFTDLTERDDIDILAPTKPVLMTSTSDSVPPPPPPPPGMAAPPPPPPPPGIAPPPPPPSCSPTPPPNSPQNTKRRTVRLFWKEVSKNTDNKLQKVSSIWQDIDEVKINQDKILHLFELRTKDVGMKKQQSEKKNKIVILDSKRSNAINIGLTVLPPPRTIKSAILHMDEFALNKEQIEKLLSMIPTEEETARIQDAMRENPDIPLGSAEQFLLTLSSVSELSARLHLWSFKLDYEAHEKEIAEPLMDLRDGMSQLKSNKTLKCILAVLKSIGNFLNGTKVKGFDIKYLAKVPEVKDTVHKQSLLHHLTQLVIEHFPNTSDLYSEIGSITRASKGDFGSLQETLETLESRCKQSWDHLKSIAKHETKATQRNKMSDFLLGAAQRIITLGVVYKRLINRFHQTLVYFGMSPQDASKMEVSAFCRLISEFALEYRTAKERVVTQQQKKQKRGERSKTRGKLITEENLFSDVSEPDDAVFHLTRKFSQTDEQIKQRQMESALILGAGDVRVDRRQRCRSSRVKKEVTSPTANGHATKIEENIKSPTETPVRRRTSRKKLDDRSDETIMDELVKVATQTPQERTVHRRRRSRNSTRKSLRRTLRNGLTDEEKAVIMGKF